MILGSLADSGNDHDTDVSKSHRDQKLHHRVAFSNANALITERPFFAPAQKTTPFEANPEFAYLFEAFGITTALIAFATQVAPSKTHPRGQHGQSKTQEKRQSG